MIEHPSDKVRCGGKAVHRLLASSKSKYNSATRAKNRSSRAINRTETVGHVVSCEPRLSFRKGKLTGFIKVMTGAVTQTIDYGDGFFEGGSFDLSHRLGREGCGYDRQSIPPRWE